MCADQPIMQIGYFFTLRQRGEKVLCVVYPLGNMENGGFPFSPFPSSFSHSLLLAKLAYSVNAGGD